MSIPLNDDHPDVQRVRRVAKELAEFFDAVQIFASRDESGEHEGTINIHIGTGNWFTRYGQVREWIVKTDELTRIATRQNEEAP